MEDTTQTARELVDTILERKTPEERLLICAEMYEEAREFARIGMPQNLTAEEEKIYLFKRIHGKTPFELTNK